MTALTYPNTPAGPGAVPRLYGACRPWHDAGPAARGEHHHTERCLPVDAVGTPRDLADHGVDHAVQKGILVAHMRGRETRLDTQLLRDPAHADGFDAVPIGLGRWLRPPPVSGPA